MKKIISPLTFSNNVTIVEEINADKIIKKYKGFNIDVSYYFNKTPKIKVIKCNDTGYKFYYPYDITGDSSFYEHFQKFDWYYMPWKWEHEIALKYMNPNIKVLEVGCAKGAFLSRISKIIDLKECIGLELNKSAKIKTDKWEIKNQSIQDFAKNNSGSFDLVCSFQVLEHISNVYSFLKANIDCLKPSGTLIISVPNNDSFIKYQDNCLNMPPHHMGLWDEKSLKSLENIFPIKLLNIHYEELQEYHVEGYVNAIYYSNYLKIFDKIIRKINILMGIYRKQVNKIRYERKGLIGHTILAVYKKE